MSRKESLSNPSDPAKQAENLEQVGGLERDGRVLR